MNSWLSECEDRTQFGLKLLSWYDINKRSTAWRDSGNPYHVWVSEIMLQQTRVDQMGSYFTRFINLFPTIEDLADSKEDEVLKAWEGLGYYSRARNMLRTARLVVSDFHGEIPEAYEKLVGLPGIGPYTAAAISSIAFGHDHAVLDGNVVRVLSRLFKISSDPRRAAVKAQMMEIAEKLLVPGRPGDFNQAIMELGACVCMPRLPQCNSCTVASKCRAYQELDDPASLPKKQKRKLKPHYHVVAGLIWRDHEVLIAQRPKDGMLGGLWEFPGGKQEEGESFEECLIREIREELDFDIVVENLLHSVDHSYSHFKITLHLYCARYFSGRPKPQGCADWCWISPDRFEDYAFPRSDLKIIEYLKNTEYFKLALMTRENDKKK